MFKIEHNIVKIDEDTTAEEFVVSNGHRSVPQLYINETLFVEGGLDGLMTMSKEDINKRVEDLS